MTASMIKVHVPELHMVPPPVHDRPLEGGVSECCACGERFRSDSAFQAHRVGPQHSRGCLSRQGMIEKGMAQNKHGLWVETPGWKG